MNEIVPESLEKNADFDEENVCLSETPRKTCAATRLRDKNPRSARKLLATLENNTDLQSPSKSRCSERLNPVGTASSPSLQKSEKDKLSHLRKVKISLFHKGRGRRTSDEINFSVDTKSFYGSLSDLQENFTLPPESKSNVKKSSRKKRSSATHYPVHKQPVRKIKKGEINAGVGHGIKKPKRKRSSLKNDLMESSNEQNKSFREKQNENLIEKSYQSLCTSGNVRESQADNHKNVIEEKFDPTKKFFKYKSINRVNISGKRELLNSLKSKNTDYVKPVATNYLAKRRIFLNYLKQNLVDGNCNTTPHQHETNISENSETVNINDYCSVLKNYSNMKSAGEIIALESDNLNNNIEISKNNNTELIQHSTKQKDVDDLLKILEDDWNDDIQLEEEICNEVNNAALSLKEKNSVYKSSIITSTIDNVQDSVYNDINNLLNLEENILYDLENNKKTTEHEGEKYHPIFHKKNVALEQKNIKKNPNTIGQWKQNGETQYQIDVGQKMFGATQCKECNLVYHIGDVNDEKIHLKYHNSFESLKFEGWRDEHVVYEDPVDMSRVILVKPDDSCLHVNKVMEVLPIINLELGICDMELSNHKNKKFFLYVKDKTILGILIAEYLNNAFKMVPEAFDLACRTSESSPVMCGINVVWIKNNHRRQGIATTLMDVLRTNFLYGYIMSIEDIAFSITTLAGKLFVEKYTGTSNFRVY